MIARPRAQLSLLLLATGCGVPSERPGPSPTPEAPLLSGGPDAPPSVDLAPAREALPATSPPAGGWPVEPDVPGCPVGMARVSGVAGPFCIQRYEATLHGRAGAKDQADTWPRPAAVDVALTSVAGSPPSKGVSWYQAVAACAARGWHLCTSAEWQDACDGLPGPGGREWATGASEEGLCNIGRPDSVVHDASGRWPGCRTPEGVYDLEGNLWEWTDPGMTGEGGLPLTDKRGGAHYTGKRVRCAEGAVGGHPPAFDGSIGFRCCASTG